VDRLEQHRRAGHPDRATADDRIPELDRLAVLAEPVCLVGVERRALAPVEGGQRPGLRVPVQHEAAAAEPRALRLDEVQDHLHRHRRIGGRAAALEHPVARLDRERMRRRHHEALRGDRIPLGDLMGRLGLVGRLGHGLGCRGGEKRSDGAGDLCKCAVRRLHGLPPCLPARIRWCPGGTRV
jgi:hypothetical protein